MPDEPPTVPPALTAREWAGLLDLPEQTRAHYLSRSPTVSARNMALANYSLPDGDPRKLTPLHVRQLRDCAAWHRAHGGPTVAGGLDSLAATLAALLPP